MKCNDLSQQFNDSSKSREKLKPKKDIICFHRNKLGHVIKKCARSLSERDQGIREKKIEKIKIEPPLVVINLLI